MLRVVGVAVDRANLPTIPYQKQGPRSTTPPAMPHFLVHGFRWNRAGLIIHVANHDIDDASSEWVHMGSPSGAAVLDSLTNLYPDLMESLESHATDIQFVEQYGGSSDDTSYKQPYVYVCDYVARMEGLSLDVGETAGSWDIAEGPSPRLKKLRDELQADARIGLWVVECADEVRQPPAMDKEDTMSIRTLTPATKATEASSAKGKEPETISPVQKPLPSVPSEDSREETKDEPTIDAQASKPKTPLSPIRALFSKKSRKFKG
ncbi:MAG: hypothetical protein M1814_006909 [Vezdaea aestivalis]|nr:MAG: hypothetical protein M1814_006909 [Vezdaea aestivalis]